MRFLQPSLGLLVLLPMAWLAPLNSVARTASSADQDEAERVPPGHHRVLRGETVWSIAMRYNTSVGEIMDANHLDSGKLKPGTLLRIPSSDGSGSSHHSKSYVVQEVDTAHSIARSYHITEKALRDANPKVDFKHLKQGAHLSIPKASDPERSEDTAPAPVKSSEPPPAPSHGSQTHVIHGDETFTSLARRYGVKVSDLMAANPDVKPERLHEGMVIKVPSKKRASGDSSSAKEPSSDQASTPPKEKHSHPSKDVAAQKTTQPETGDTDSPPPTTKPNIKPAKTTPKVTENAKTDDSAPKAKSNDKATSKHAPDTGDKKAPPVVANTAKKDAPAPPAPANADHKKMDDNAAAVAKNDKPAPAEKKAASDPQPPPQSAKTDNSTGEVRSYIVQPGETAQAIAQSHGISVKRLLDYNHLSADAKLRTGDEIMIPKRGSVAVNR